MTESTEMRQLRERVRAYADMSDEKDRRLTHLHQQVRRYERLAALDQYVIERLEGILTDGKQVAA